MWVASFSICEVEITKRSPQTELSAFGPWGLSRGIIDDVFITRCGVMWGLGHRMSVSACGGGQVDSAASFLTPTTPVLGTDKSSLPNALIRTYTHALKESHTLTLLHTRTQRQMHTHTHTPNPFPKINYLKLNQNAEEKKLTCSLVCRSVSSQCHARPLADLSVSCLLGPLWNPNAVAPKILTAT